MRKKHLLIAAIIIIAGVIIGSLAIYAYSILSGISGEQLNEKDLGINKNLSDTVLNVALFGLDGRDTYLEDGSHLEGNRSDTIMIASANFKTGEIKVVSVMRDLIARIPETDQSFAYYEKINAAYALGGVQAAVRALNENFDLNISDYVSVDFNCVVDAVDALGGLEINIQNDEVLDWTNRYIWDVNAHTGHDSPNLEHSGMNHVDGAQALAYCRNRYSDSDYGRTERQREILSLIAQKAMNMDLGTTIGLITKIYPYVQTSFSLSELVSYYEAFVGNKNSEQERQLDTSRLPFDFLNTTGDINGGSYVIPCTMEDNVKVLHGYLYGEDNYLPSETAQKISNDIIATTGYGSNIDWTKMTWRDIIDMQTSVRDEFGNPSPENYPPAQNTATPSGSPQ